MIDAADDKTSRPYFNDSADDLRRRFEAVRMAASEADFSVLVSVWLELYFHRTHLRNNGATFTRAGRLFEEVDYALDELQARWNVWPNTGAPGGSGDLDGTDWNLDSPLSRLGYSVAGSPDRQTERRRILTAAFDSEIPCRNDDEVKAWGAPRSGVRLHRIALHIAVLVRNQKRRSAPSRRAIDRWEADLAWLKATYFDTGDFSFPWPARE